MLDTSFWSESPTDAVVIPCSESHFELTWRYEGKTGRVLIGRKGPADKDWQVIAWLPSSITRYESTGCLAGTTYEHRLWFGSREAPSWGISLDFGPCTTLPWSHPQRCTLIESSRLRQDEGALIVHPDGSLAYYYTSYHSGSSDKDRARIARKVSRSKGVFWDAQEILFDQPEWHLLHPGVAHLADGRLGLSYAKMKPHTWTAHTVFRASADGGRTWSEEARIDDGSFAYSTCPMSRLYRLEDGRLLQVLHVLMRQEPHKQLKPQKVLGTQIYLSEDNGHTWRNQTPEPLTVLQNNLGTREMGLWECAVVETKGHFLLLGRTATGWFYESRSGDGGRTWSAPPQPSTVRSPLASPWLSRIPGTDTILLLYNSHVQKGLSWCGGSRRVLAAQISDNGGRAWRNHKLLEYDPLEDWYDYPCALIDGQDVHIGYRKRDGGARARITHLAYTHLPLSWFLESS